MGAVATSASCWDWNNSRVGAVATSAGRLFQLTLVVGEKMITSCSQLYRRAFGVSVGLTVESWHVGMVVSQYMLSGLEHESVSCLQPWKLL